MVANLRSLLGPHIQAVFNLPGPEDNIYLNFSMEPFIIVEADPFIELSVPECSISALFISLTSEWPLGLLRQLLMTSSLTFDFPYFSSPNA